jgi:hypothetical protein
MIRKELKSHISRRQSRTTGTGHVVQTIWRFVREEQGKKEQKGKERCQARPAITEINPSHKHRLPLQGRGRQQPHAEVLRNKFVVYLVADVAQRDGLQQPEIVHRLQPEQLDVAGAAACMSGILPWTPMLYVRWTKSSIPYQYVEPWALYSVNAKAGLIET